MSDMPEEGKLTDRLRGRYSVGPIGADGEPQFGWRNFPTVPIQLEAATHIEALETLYDSMNDQNIVLTKALVAIARDPNGGLAGNPQHWPCYRAISALYFGGETISQEQFDAGMAMLGEHPESVLDEAANIAFLKADKAQLESMVEELGDEDFVSAFSLAARLTAVTEELEKLEGENNDNAG